MPDLNGSLSSFGLPRVLELLRDVGTSGEMLVISDEVRGRLLMREGRVAYATTASGSDTVAELDALLRDYGDEGTEDGLRPLEGVLMEQLADVIYELGKLETGTFEVVESPVLHEEDVFSFTVDDVLRGVEDRIEEWNRIRTVIPSDDVVLRFAPRLPDESGDVTFDAATWSLLATIGGGASMAEVTASMAAKQLSTAKSLVNLIERGVVEVDGTAVDESSDPVVELKMESEPEVPHLVPTDEPVTFSAEDLSRDEIDDVIRNIGRGIFPG